MLNNATHRWLTVGLLLATATYAIAEELTLTTYYPSPRGVYQELRTAGDVGIGDITNPPGARLHVTQTGPDPALQVTQTGAADALRVEDQASPDPSPFVIDQTGSVGIGTTTPGYKLDVVTFDDGTGAAAIRIRPETAGLGPGVLFHDNAGSYYGAIGAAALNDHYLDGSIAGDMAIKSVSGGISLGTCVGGAPPCPARLRLDASGNVGIGTATPGGTLHVVKPVDDGTPAFLVEDQAGDPTPFVIDQTGNVGIGGGRLQTGADNTGMFWIKSGPDEGGGPLTNPAGDNVIGWNNAPGFAGRDITLLGRTQIGDLSQPWAIQDLIVSGNVGVGTTTPNPAAPNGQPGNLDANDVYIRSTSQWASESNALSSSYVGSCNANGSSCKCNAGEKIMLLEGFEAKAANWPCSVAGQNSSAVQGVSSDGGLGGPSFWSTPCSFSCFK